MSDEMIVEFCSPTLAGIKTANLFTCEYGDRDEIVEDIKDLNKRYVSKGIRFIPVRFCQHKALIYVYRPKLLKKDLLDQDAMDILEKLGYKVDSPETCVACLRRRLSEFKCSQEFPHEIGFFLGYPSEDVIGFIENKACDFKCVGCWKVYGDAAKAKRTFNMYDKCTMDYKHRFGQGIGLDQLVVGM